MIKTMYTALALALAASAQATIKLPHILSDGMVIQQNTDVQLWGTAEAGSQVSITSSWGGAATTTADQSGAWKAAVRSPKASYKQQTITITDGQPLTLRNVLVGEVWVCAGQSNMEMPVKGFDACPVEGYNDCVAEAADDRAIRSCKIPSDTSMTTRDDANCHWVSSSPKTVGDFSATGYFFARTVAKVLGVPVGLIEANKGGSRVESWLDEANLKAIGQSLNPADWEKQWGKAYWVYPLICGTAIFHPIINYTVGGIIFYQGCSNVGDPGNAYSDKLKTLVEQWRRDLRNPELPFYFVEIAPFCYENDCMKTLGADLRMQQQRAAQIIPNSGLIGINDLLYPHEARQIHPCQKPALGRRLANKVLKHVYGHKELKADCPTFQSMTVEGDTIKVKFDNLEGGIGRWDDVQGFEVCGSDGVYHKATGWFDYKKGFVVRSPEVKHPVGLSYCYRNVLLGNFINCGGLPLMPFKTGK